MEHLLKKLESIGLTQNEGRMYLVLLDYAESTATQLTRKTGIARTNTYSILDSLTSKGLVAQTAREPKTTYRAFSPESLEKYTTKRREQIEKEIDTTEELIFELNQKYQPKSRPKISYYEGTDGLKHVYDDTLTASEDIFACSTYEYMHEVLPNYFPKYYEKRAKKNIFAYGIVPDTPDARERKNQDKQEKRDLSLVDKAKYPIPTEIDVYNNKVMIASWREKLGVIIESEEIATTLKSIFKLALIGAKSLSK
jgi:sugar-specific transcriptional regulator TrmB